jgi:hypothetical protein
MSTDLASVVYRVELEHSKLDSLVHTLHLLWLSVCLLLALLSSTTQTQHLLCVQPAVVGASQHNQQ